MNKNGDQLNERRGFVKIGVNAPTKAANRLMRIAKKLKKARNMRERVAIICTVLYLSEDTIYRDYLSD